MDKLPFGDKAVDCVDHAVLGHRIEEAGEVVVGGMKWDVRGGVGWVVAEAVP